MGKYDLRRAFGGGVNPSSSGHSEEQHLPSAECWLKTQAVCRTFQPNEDTFNANVVIDNEESHRRKDFTNSAILRGLNSCSPQKDSKICVARWKISRKIAFTLVEVLITLGIIGVVAAITIPNIVNKYNEKVFEVQFKKEYSVLNNAISSVQLNNNLNECYITYVNGGYYANNSDCLSLKNEIISQLKLTPIMVYSNFTPKTELIAKGGSTLNNTVSYDQIVADASAYMMPDGAVVLLGTTQNGSPRYADVVFVLDVNGSNGPNKWGYDVFWLTLNQKNGTLRLTDEYASLVDKGGKLPRTILLNESENSKSMKTWGVW